jgi:hypothetical protein
MPFHIYRDFQLDVIDDREVKLVVYVRRRFAIHYLDTRFFLFRFSFAFPALSRYKGCPFMVDTLFRIPSRKDFGLDGFDGFCNKLRSIDNHEGAQ